MQQYIKAHGAETSEPEMGCELAEEELVAICGGTTGPSTRASNVPGNAPGFGSLGNTFGNLGSTLDNQFNGLLESGSTAPTTTGSNTTPALSVNSYPLLGGLF